MDFLKKAASTALENSSHSQNNNTDAHSNTTNNNSGINTGNTLVDGLLGKVTDAVGVSGEKAEQKEGMSIPSFR